MCRRFWDFRCLCINAVGFVPQWRAALFHCVYIVKASPPSLAECAAWEHLQRPNCQVLLWRVPPRAPACLRAAGLSTRKELETWTQKNKTAAVALPKPPCKKACLVCGANPEVKRGSKELKFFRTEPCFLQFFMLLLWSAGTVLLCQCILWILPLNFRNCGVNLGSRTSWGKYPMWLCSCKWRFSCVSAVESFQW